MASSISAARLALYNLLVAAATVDSGTALAGVQVSWGVPVEFEEQEVIALGGISFPSSGWETFTPGERTVAFASQIAGKAHGPADDPSVVETRALDFYEAIRVLIDANPTLSGTATDARLTGVESDGPIEASPGRVMFFTAQVDCAVVVPV